MSGDITIPLIPGRGRLVVELDGGERVAVTGYAEGTVGLAEHVETARMGLHGEHSAPTLREQTVTVAVTFTLTATDQLSYEHGAAALRRGDGDTRPGLAS